ncbi:MAG: response regulator transcription factor [Clostridiales bacterium]|nr:response regulator transcription factor [Clostridiales bacterium]
MNETILVVDDDKEIADLVEIHLVSDGYQVRKANQAEEGLKLFEENDISLAILDIMMPGMDGMEMCKRIREKSAIPIIFLSAKSTDMDKILGLANGADDYVIKPFSPLELMARVKSQLRRYTTLNPGSGQENGADKDVDMEYLTIRRASHQVIVYGKEVKLTPIEFDILYLLASHPGQVYSTEDIFREVWHEEMIEANNTVMVHIRRIREKIELNSRNAKIIKTVWGVGYKVG